MKVIPYFLAPLNLYLQSQFVPKYHFFSFQFLKDDSEISLAAFELLQFRPAIEPEC